MKPIVIEGLPTARISVTRELADICQRVQDEAKASGAAIELDTLAAGSPSEDTFSTHADNLFMDLHVQAMARAANRDEGALWNAMSNYASSYGPIETRRVFDQVYGTDHGLELKDTRPETKPGNIYDRLVPAVGGTGAIYGVVHSFDSMRKPYAALHTEPTYAGFFAAIDGSPYARPYGVQMDNEGPIIDSFEETIKAARAAGLDASFFYLVPIGDNPNGLTYSASRMEALVKKARELGVILVEDHPYNYIQYGDQKVKPLLYYDQLLHGMDGCVVHIFTASKIWNPGNRAAYVYSNVSVDNRSGAMVDFNTKIVESLARTDLMHSPLALWRFYSFMHDIEGVDRNDPVALRALMAGGGVTIDRFKPRSLWNAAQGKLDVYAPMRTTLMRGLDHYFEGTGLTWTQNPDGFFVRVDDPGNRLHIDKAFFESFMKKYGVMIVPLYGFYSQGNAPMNNFRLAFSPFSGGPEKRQRDLERAINKMGNGIRSELGLRLL